LTLTSGAPAPVGPCILLYYRCPVSSVRLYRGRTAMASSNFGIASPGRTRCPVRRVQPVLSPWPPGSESVGYETWLVGQYMGRHMGRRGRPGRPPVAAGAA